MNKYYKHIRYLVMIFAIVVFTYSAYELMNIYLDYKESKDAYTSIDDLFRVDPSDYDNQETDKNGRVVSNKNENPWVWNFNEMLAFNSDAKGYIRQGNHIAYPIVQTTDNEYYLNHLVDHTRNKAGSIFIDYRIEEGLEAQNAIIYGHNMKDDSMFGTFRKYKNKYWYNSNPTFDVYVGHKHYRYHIFAVYETHEISDTYTYKFADEERYAEYLKTSKEKSIYNIDVTPTAKDKIITLSTCTSTGDEYRLIVQAVRGELIKDYSKNE